MVGRKMSVGNPPQFACNNFELFPPSAESLSTTRHKFLTTKASVPVSSFGHETKDRPPIPTILQEK